METMVNKIKNGVHWDKFYLFIWKQKFFVPLKALHLIGYQVMIETLIELVG